jgi:YlmC/YmxH family sporulation protein
MLLKELQSKDVVNVIDGYKLGKITDIEIDSETGKILVFTVSKYKNFIFFGTEQVKITWDKIVKLGGEVIIVNCND